MRGRIHRARSTTSRRACALAGVSLLASLAAAPALGQAATGAQQTPRPSAPAEPTVDVSLPLILDGVYIGDIGARTTVSGTLVSLAGQRFIELLGSRLNDETRAELAARIAAEGDFLPLSQAQVPGLAVSFDAANFAVAVSVSAAVAKPMDFALSPNIVDAPRENTMLPADLALGVNLFFSKSYLHRDRLAPAREGWQPTTLGIDGVANLGGIDGVYLFHQWTYRGGPDGRLTRGNVTLVHDDWRRAVRAQAGDVDPFVLPLQGAAPIGGIAVLRAYADLQPTRNIRPAGRTTFTLDRDAIVEVEVNGVVTRTVQLRAGTYNLRDLPFTEGLNEVRLLVQDEAGRREIAAFSRSFTTNLLEEGLSEFSFAFGVPRTPTDGGFRYGDDLQFTGYFRKGITQSITLGLNAQADRQNQTLGGEAIWATRVGTFRLEAAGSTSDRGEGFATTLGWVKSFSMFGKAGEVEAFWDHRSRDFTVLNQLFAQDIKDDIAVRYRQALPLELYLNAAFGRSSRRIGPDRTVWSAGLSRSFGRINAAMLYEGQSDQILGTDHRIHLNVSWRLGPREGVNARYESGSNSYRVEHERVLTNEVGSLGYRAGVSGADGERGFQGQVDYFTNRGEVGARFDLFDDTAGGGRIRQSTLRAAVGVGMADGSVAVGRPYREGFAIVSRHKSLDGKPVDVSIGGAKQAYARADGFGPALVTANRPYQRNVMSVNVDDLPAGYDLGAGAFELYPGSGSGFKLTVGSEASNTVMGVLLGRNGQPVSLQVGRLVSLDRPQEQAISLFTNKAGRFAATGLKPGRYRLTVNGEEASELEIVVPADSSGLVALGSVQLEGTER
jgi:outer membrane usher protein